MFFFLEREGKRVHLPQIFLQCNIREEMKQKLDG